ncbi:hypothetical protein [Niveispirillum sp. KHB5.9]|uniref:hypothetical protein n=1 Tax=Niveispirillum sp. KHB5.9 TaxID=3400269 RepID=UPI003A88B6A9
MLCLLALFCWVAPVRGEPTIIRIALTPEGSHQYFHELLKAAFLAAGHPVELQGIVGPGKERFKMMLRTGELDVMWLVRGAERDQLYVPVEFRLTDGLIGQRILLIRPGEQHRFDQIDSLDDFARLGLRAGMGKDWLDVGIWRQNGMPETSEVPEWRRLFKMLSAGNRAVDYIPRGLSEIQIDANANPELAVEQRLLLRYHRDSIFYLTPSAGHLAPILLRGLQRIRANGRYAALLDKHFGHLKQAIGTDRRLVLDLTDNDDPTPVR